LYRYQTPADFHQRWLRFSRTWQTATALEPRTLALAGLLGAIRCGHTHINPYNLSKATRARLFEGKALLPFRFRWLGERMVITGDPHSVGLAPGTQVLAIDERPAAALLRSLLPLARADGSNDAKRRALMGIRGQAEWEEFDLFQPLLQPLGPTADLAVMLPDGRKRTIKVPTVDRRARVQARSQASSQASSKGNDQPQWTLTRRGSVAVLTMDNWALYNSKWDWKRWLNERFSEIVADGTRGLVIDLRANEGGEDCGDLVLAHLTQRVIPAEAIRRLVRFRDVPMTLRKPLDTWDPSFFGLGKDAVTAPGGYYRLPAADSGGSDPVAPLAPRFTGKVVILTSPTNSSATFQFAQRARDAGLATLVGEPTGGNLRGINGGAYFFVRLPDSGLEFDLPLIGYFPESKRPDAGLVPDVLVPVSAAAIADGRDEAFERALQVLA
jgi:hypothetical protein